MKPVKYYNNQKQKAESKLLESKKKKKLNSVLRLLTFILIFVSVFGLMQIHAATAIVVSVFFLVVFLTLVKRHLWLSKEQSYFSQVEKIAAGELDALSNDFRQFEKGEEFLNPEHAFSYDLDLFGKGSLFEMLNRSTTEMGKIKLAQRISNYPDSAESIYSLQSSTKELSGMPDFLIKFRAIGAMSGIVKEDLEAIDKWKKNISFVNNRKGLRFFSFFLPGLLITALVATIIDSSFSSQLTTIFIFNLAFVGFKLRTINKEHNEVSGLLKMLLKYQKLLQEIEQQNFNAELLKHSQKVLEKNGKKASEVLNDLTKLVGAFDSRMNLVAAIFLQGFLLWDYHCLFRINNWRKEYSNHLKEWLEEIAFIDTMISSGTYAYNSPDFIYPEITDKEVLKGENIGHPLIPSSVRVCNDFDISERGNFAIITGANMAGKSTFLRTVGVNLVLGKAGLPVCAESLSFSNQKLFTSMRTSDSLSENESYFYAELKRLKSVMDKLEAGEDLFIILDEILKGTNSVDKQNGSKHAMEKILKLNGTGIIATHDLALTKISESYPGRVKNQCFEIEIDKAKIFFDYKLYHGVTKKMNAMLLMEQMGIV